MLRRAWSWIIIVFLVFICEVSLANSASSDLCVTVGYRHTDRVVRLTGELTRKGSDMESWWSLRVEAGSEYKLQLARKTLEKSFYEWQNQQVTVVGTSGGKFLSLDVICVVDASLSSVRHVR